MSKMTRRTPSTTSIQSDTVVKTKKDLICSIVKKKTKEKFLSENQKNYYQTLTNNQITVCSVLDLQGLEKVLWQ